VSSPELNIGLWILLGDLMDSSILINGGVRRADGELNIGLWRVLGDLTRVEYWTRDNVG
jgi:hypothetical protein